MSKKPLSSTPKICCERFKKHLRSYSVKCNSKQCILKNTCPSIKETQPSQRSKSLPTGILTKNTVAKPKKTTKSDLIFNEIPLSNCKFVDCNKNCGDTLALSSKNSKSNNKHYSTTALNKVSNTPAITQNRIQNGKKSLLKQFYKNVNFQQSTESLHSADPAKASNLIPIKEQLENLESSSFFEILSDSEPDEAGYIDPVDQENIKRLKQFREQNYFECHSAKTRINTKGSVTSLNNHKCVYRFYLNDRLFPVPLNTDYNNNIRCIDCHLPLQDTDYNSVHSNINGTIQAKVKLNNEVQDMMLMLPVTKSFIVKERRTELENKKDEDFVYFGIIKLNLNGDSIFNRNVPSNSFALKYQKGYKELHGHKKYEYDSLDKNDIIII